MFKVEQLLKYSEQIPLLFNQYAFLFLFTLVFAGYSLVHKKVRLRNFYLLIFSLFFYYKSSGLYFFLLLFSTLVDYGCGFGIYLAKQKWEKKFYLILSLIANLGLLAFFKYSYFIVDSINIWFDTNYKAINFLAAFANGTFGSGFNINEIILPVGISFYTFQTLSYSIDIYRNKIKPCGNIFDFAFFVSFFPQLVAGPIVRASEFLPQIKRPYYLSKSGFGKAVFLIMAGLSKKVIISDYISVNFVDRVFETPEMYSGFMNLMAVYGYSIQIYCDFSGYSDMAIGLAALLGFKLPINFNSPYKAQNITDFWRRWHISLSTWLRDYLYISLGGNRKGKTYINLAITMLLGGLWHGAAAKFIIWGGLHGIALTLHKIWLKNRYQFCVALSAALSIFGLFLMFSGFEIQFYGIFLLAAAFASLLVGFFFKKVDLTFQLNPKVSSFFAAVITFHFVAFCWMYFRAADVPTVVNMLNNILTDFNFSGIGSRVSAYWKVFVLIAVGFTFHFLPGNLKNRVQWWFTESPMYVKVLIFVLVVFVTYQATSAEIQPFIYFQF